MSGLIVKRVIGAVLLAISSGCGLASSLVMNELVEDINRLSPESEELSPLGWYYPKFTNVWRKYRLLYPDGTRLRTLKRLTIIGCVSGLLGFRLIFGPNFFGI